jgi:Zn-dependent protease
VADLLFSQLQNPMFIVEIFIVLASLVIHEFSHALTADILGDRTARLSGRLTLNPLVHLELFGLLMILFAPIGWARPVPINARNFRNPRLGFVITALAGPISNLLLAFICLFALFLVPVVQFGIGGQILEMAVIVNVALFLFNLIPLPPLDGSQVIRNLLPYRQAVRYSKLDIYGPFILLLLFVIPQIGQMVFMPIVQFFVSLFASWFGLNL